MKINSTMDNPFARTLQEHGLDLVRDRCHTLQVNVGLKSDLACRHCHLSAGPTRGEIMSRQTMEEVIDFAGRDSFQTADITGWAPELVPDLDFLIAGLAAEVPRIMLRSKLTALGTWSRESLIDLCRRLKVTIVASLPAVSPSQVEAPSGTGVLDGTHYDCDFNQGAGLPMGGHRMHIRDLDGPPPAGAAIVTGEHCYACTAGSGLT
jgi:hypothetical protein